MSGAPTATGPAPGVTADTIKIGVTYVDANALKVSGLNYTFGDFEGAYNALANDINDKGGINGRKIQLVFAPIDPTSPTPADQACVRLTEDEDVFMIIGFFLADSVICPVATHQTAVAGGEMTPERLQQAAAPWLTWNPDTDLPTTAVKAFGDKNLLKGKVAVYAADRDKTIMDNQVVPALNSMGVTPVATGIMDAPATDPTAVAASVQTIAEKFKSAGADTVVLVGLSAQDWPTSMTDNPYRPKLLFLDVTGARAFNINKATTDRSVLDGSLAAGVYGPPQAQFETKAMQDCVTTLSGRGITTPAPSASGDDPSNVPYQATFFACDDMTLMKAWLEAAGPNLNYGTLQSAMDTGFKVTIPGDPTERTYGKPPDADGNPRAYVYNWDNSKQDYVLSQ